MLGEKGDHTGRGKEGVHVGDQQSHNLHSGVNMLGEKGGSHRQG
jgi:hypothetical protein